MREEGRGILLQIVPPRTEDTIEDDSTIDVGTTIEAVEEDLHVIMRIEEDEDSDQMDHHSNSSYVVV